MNNEEAKRVLLAYRPGLAVQDDPEVAEALALAQEDETLQGWLEQHEAFQEAVRSELRAMPVPRDLKARILTRQSRRKKIITPIWRPEFLLAAACLALGLILSALWMRGWSEAQM